MESIEAAGAALFTVEGQTLGISATYVDPASGDGVGLSATGVLVRRAAGKRTPVQDPDARDGDSERARSLAIPLVLAGEVTGVLTASRLGPAFDEDEVATLQHLGNVAALAIRNAKLLAAAKESGLAQQKFMNMAAHELRTPLAVIRGYLSMLVEGVFGPGTESWGEALDILSAKSEELAQLIEELLMAARLEATTGLGRQSVVDLRGVAQDAPARVRARASLVGGEVQISLPQAPVWADVDSETLGRVLDNLVNNALTYSDRPAWVRISVRGGEHPTVEVEDHGWGIPLHLRDRVFENFYRVDDPAHPYPAGTGLGLAIGREIVERHGGNLTLAWSEIGRGSRFRLELPTARGSIDDPAARPVLGARASSPAEVSSQTS